MMKLSSNLFCVVECLVVLSLSDKGISTRCGYLRCVDRSYSKPVWDADGRLQYCQCDKSDTGWPCPLFDCKHLICPFGLEAEKMMCMTSCKCNSLQRSTFQHCPKLDCNQFTCPLGGAVWDKRQCNIDCRCPQQMWNISCPMLGCHYLNCPSGLDNFGDALYICDFCSCKKPDLLYIKQARACYMQPDAGSCSGQFERWYYNSQMNRCQKFVYGGCVGNANNFETEMDCMSSCGQTLN